ncbi:NAD(P)H-binding protein [Saccharopolyspora erythraea]|uniref:NAD(P)H-binding protein n=1 Tax=Saccharopolyspora erythraea TaxID=1836 RepID=UPI001BEE698C|nr:NAD(P)H-binding protein [Saccharopolyspora erythraea]QUH00020.1 NAD(P)H-binding protein [Saccharopolyspora erythraea]
MTNSTILVLGGTGKTGRRVAAKLAARGFGVRVASRRGAVRFDWDDRSTWAPALEGVDAAYVVAPSETDDGETISEFIPAATAAGAGRLVLLSAREVETSMGTGLKAAEAAVRRSDARWTILRPSWFAQNFSEDMFLPLINAGLVALPTGDGEEPFIDAEDIADVAVAALTEEGHDQQVYELSGPDLLSFPEAVKMIAAASGRDVAFKAVTAAEFMESLLGNGLPEDVARMVTDLLDAIRRGENAHLSDGVRRALGRPPRPFADYVREVWGA